ncbi:MAG: hypothetical protein ABIO70_13080 [Pseudomonadota bacterium]
MPATALPHPDRERRFLGLLVGWLALRQVIGVLVALGVLALMALIALPGFVGFEGHARVAEVRTVLHQIRSAERAWEAEHDVFLPVPVPVPVPREEISEAQHSWPPDSAFAQLGVDPGGPVRGTYWVEVADDGHSFVAHGLIDVQGDGDARHWTATETQDPEPLP